MLLFATGPGIDPDISSVDGAIWFLDAYIVFEFLGRMVSSIGNKEGFVVRLGKRNGLGLKISIMKIAPATSPKILFCFTIK